MNTTAQRDSEGTRSARQLLADTTRASMPQPLLLKTGSASQKPAPKLRMIKAAHASAECGFGTCALTPACTRQCRYREDDQALRGHYSERHTQRADMPEPPMRMSDHQARRIAAILLTAWCVGWLGMSLYWLTT